ncbi:MAG: type 4a pilus biogenesis protein PilO, partial [Candidatus Omnitrophica bacterium]|nr:type 4a pilus biogenesis protein PilO [Candidatus Omnitrophota bacterium]
VDLVFLASLQSQGIRNKSLKIAKIKKDIDGLNRDLTAIKRSSGTKDGGLEQGFRQTRVISEEEIPALLKEIANIANNNNIKIMQIRPLRNFKGKEEPVAGLKKFSVLGIGMDLSCGYHDLGKFLSELDECQQVILVENMKIAPASLDSFQQKVNLLLKTYVKK